MKHDVIISNERYEMLLRDHEALEEYKKTGKMITFYFGHMMGGRYVEIKTNTDLFDVLKEKLSLHEQDAVTWRKRASELFAENEKLQRKGFFKRLFS